jgi:hypothetical protein
MTAAGAYGDILKVPTTEYPYISDALADAGYGDVVFVMPGTYSPGTTGDSFPIEITAAHNGITLQGAGLGVTVLDAGADESSPGRVLTVQNVVGFTLQGLTITGGHVVTSDPKADFATGNGGGIYVYKSKNLTISNCEITGNEATGTWATRDGEGNYDWSKVKGTDGSTTPAHAGGGGIYLRYSKDGSSPTVTIEHCLIHDNKTGMGGGGLCSNYAPAVIRHCCIYDNTASRGGGVYWFDYVYTGTRIEHILFNDLIVSNDIEPPAYYGYYESSGSWSDDEGGGAYLSNWGTDQKFRIYSTTAADNHGFEVYVSHDCQNADLKGANNIFWPEFDEDAGDYDSKGFYDNGYEGGSDFTYSDIWWRQGEAYPGLDRDSDGDNDGDDATANGNIFSEPLFDQYGYGDVICLNYFLERSSLAVDTGYKDATSYTPTIYNPNWFTTDVTGIRDGVDGKELDMGYHSMRYGASYIQLVSFTARGTEAGVALQWETGLEVDNAGFLVFRAQAGTTNYQRISDLIASQGVGVGGASYRFVDTSAAPGVSYDYWLVDLDTSGNWAVNGPVAGSRLLTLAPVSSSDVSEVLAR